MSKAIVLTLDVSELFDLVECYFGKGERKGFMASRYAQLVKARQTGSLLDGSHIYVAFTATVVRNAVFTLEKKGVCTSQEAQEILDKVMGAAKEAGYGLVDETEFSFSQIQKRTASGGFDYDPEDTSVLMSMEVVAERLAKSAKADREVTVGLLSNDRRLVEHVVSSGGCARFARDVVQELAA